MHLSILRYASRLWGLVNGTGAVTYPIAVNGLHIRIICDTSSNAGTAQLAQITTNGSSNTGFKYHEISINGTVLEESLYGIYWIGIFK